MSEKSDAGVGIVDLKAAWRTGKAEVSVCRPKNYRKAQKGKQSDDMTSNLSPSLPHWAQS